MTGGGQATESEPRCLNCGSSLSDAYCATCGQGASTGRLQAREILGDAVANLFNLDFMVPRTVIGLTRDPGRVVTDYVEGHRAAYVSPLRYCLIAVAVMLVIFTALDIDPMNITATTDSSDAVVQERMEMLRIEMVRIVNARMNLVIFAALPLFGLILRGLFRRSGRNYAECTAFTFFVMGHVFLLGIPIGLLRPVVPKIATIAQIGLQIIWMSWAAVSFFSVSRAGAVVKSVVASFAYAVVVMLIVVALAGPQIFRLLRQAGMA